MFRNSPRPSTPLLTVNQCVDNLEDASQAASLDNTMKPDQFLNYLISFDVAIVETTNMINDTQPKN